MSSAQWSRLGALVAIVQLIAACAGSAVGTSTSTPTATAPVITIQPTSQAVTAGQPATFTVAALGTTPCSISGIETAAPSPEQPLPVTQSPQRAQQTTAPHSPPR